MRGREDRRVPRPPTHTRIKFATILAVRCGRPLPGAGDAKGADALGASWSPRCQVNAPLLGAPSEPESKRRPGNPAYRVYRAQR